MNTEKHNKKDLKKETLVNLSSRDDWLITFEVSFLLAI